MNNTLLKGLVLVGCILQVAKALRCGHALLVGTHKECRRHPVNCAEKCFIQKTEDESGNFRYTAGCATNQECIFMKYKIPLMGKRAPLTNHVCEECCDDGDMCNMDMCYTSSAADLFHKLDTTTTKTPTTTTQPISPLSCEQCSGPLCGLAPSSSKSCPVSSPYCINTLINSPDGSRTITKGCASYAECSVKWWKGTSGKSECLSYDMKNVYPFALSCSYCCTSDNCNTDLIPSHSTFTGH